MCTVQTQVGDPVPTYVQGCSMMAAMCLGFTAGSDWAECCEVTLGVVQLHPPHEFKRFLNSLES